MDSFIALKGDSLKPKAFAVSQTVTNCLEKTSAEKPRVASAYTPRFGDKLAKPVSTSRTASGGATPLKQTVWYTCQKMAEYRTWNFRSLHKLDLTQKRTSHS